MSEISVDEIKFFVLSRTDLTEAGKYAISNSIDAVVAIKEAELSAQSKLLAEKEEKLKFAEDGMHSNLLELIKVRKSMAESEARIKELEGALGKCAICNCSCNPDVGELHRERCAVTIAEGVLHSTYPSQALDEYVTGKVREFVDKLRLPTFVPESDADVIINGCRTKTNEMIDTLLASIPKGQKAEGEREKEA